MTKEKIIQDLKKRIERDQYFVDYFIESDYKQEWLWNQYIGKVEAFKVALCLVESMHDDEYWNESIANAIAMGDR